MKSSFLMSFLLFPLFMAGCLSSGVTLTPPQVIISSNEIKIPDDIVEDVDIQLNGPARNGSALYANPGGIDVTINNKSDSIIKVLWSKSSFLSPEGQSHVIMLPGMKYGDAGQAPPDSVVPPSEFVRTQAFYADNLSIGSFTFIQPIPTSSTKLLVCIEVEEKEYYSTIEVWFGKKPNR